jgi:hypothetical protein
MQININNVEELIFYDSDIQKLLPEHIQYFNQWKISKLAHVKSIEKKTLLDFLNNLTDPSIIILENYFGCKIDVVKINYHLSNNIFCKLCETENINNMLENTSNFADFALYRDQDNLYISFLR